MENILDVILEEKLSSVENSIIYEDVLSEKQYFDKELWKCRFYWSKKLKYVRTILLGMALAVGTSVVTNKSMMGSVVGSTFLTSYLVSISGKLLVLSAVQCKIAWIHRELKILNIADERVRSLKRKLIKNYQYKEYYKQFIEEKVNKLKKQGRTKQAEKISQTLRELLAIAN